MEEGAFQLFALRRLFTNQAPKMTTMIKRARPPTVPPINWTRFRDEAVVDSTADGKGWNGWL